MFGPQEEEDDLPTFMMVDQVDKYSVEFRLEDIRRERKWYEKIKLAISQCASVLQGYSSGGAGGSGGLGMSP